MERFEAECVVIGAGVIGLAIAAALARAGREVVILEKNDAFGAETSSRNSEVIHAGLYYAPGSLKARFCVEGRDRLYAWCAERGVPHRRCGKLIVAADAEDAERFAPIRATAAAAGVSELHPISGRAAREMEPALAAEAALHSPLTGIVDSHALMLSLLGAAEDHGAQLALNAPVLRGAAGPRGVALEIGGAAPARIEARVVVNAAGLWAQRVAARIDGAPAESVPPTVLFKGHYFALEGARAPFSRLIYPTPVPGGLGVHLTLDLGGSARFGPDVEPLATDDPAAIDYTVPPDRDAAFEASIRRYWPALPSGRLRPDYAGVRPKIDPDYGADFRIDGPDAHGVPGLINLFGFESPGLTGCLPIGDAVARRVSEL